MSNVNFISQAIQDYYEGVGSTATTSQLTTFRDGGGISDAADKQSLASAIAGLEQRIATFESTLIADPTLPNSLGNEDFPFDRESLKREFLDEILAALIRGGYGFTLDQYFIGPSNGNANNPQPTSTPVASPNGAKFGGEDDPNLPVTNLTDVGLSLWTRSTATATKSWDHCNPFEFNPCDGSQSDFESSLNSDYPLGYVGYTPSYSTATGNQTYTITYYTYTQVFQDFVDDNFATLYDFDTFTHNGDQLLNNTGKAIFAHYEDLIDRVFAEGDKLRNNPIDPTGVVTTLSGVTINGTTYTQLLTRTNYTGGLDVTATANSADLASTGHSFQVGDRITFTPPSLGTLPTELNSTDKFFVVSTSTNSFQVATERGGTAIVMTTAGSGDFKAERAAELLLFNPGSSSSPRFKVEKNVN